MKAFQVTGSYDASRVGYRKSMQNFSVQVAAVDENAAKEKVLSDLGSKHRKRREEIALAEVKPLAAADVTDPVVKHQIGEK
jgi:large subunit ribosomal protein LX